MEIKKAYCIELDKIVDIYEAAHHFFSRYPDGEGERFTFLCSSSECRLKGITVTGVNYHRKIEKDSKYVASHFRDGKDPANEHGHDNDCEWIEREEAKRLVIGEPGRYGRVDKGPLKKSSDLINVFRPKITVDPADGIEKDHSDKIKRIPDKQTRIAAYKEQYKENINRSSYLHEVISCYKNMSSQQRLNERLQIGKSVSSYAEMIKHIGNHKNNSDQRIYYGGAMLLKIYGEYGARFRFFDSYQNQRKIKNDDSNSIYLYLSPISVRNYQHSATLVSILRELEDNLSKIRNGSTENKMYVRCYFYGSITNNSNCLEKGYNVTVDHYDNLLFTLETLRKPRMDDAR